jgi:3-oxoacyl-[acyl-carrier-protein] synthase-3
LKFEKGGIGIIGFGAYVPDRIITNRDLEKEVDTTDEWIRKRTGICERRKLEDGVPAYTMGVEAARKALENAGISAEELDLIIVTTVAPDYLTPSMSCLIQRELGAVNAAAFDLNAACAGMVYGMTVARQFVETNFYRNVIVIGCEGLSRIIDWKDRNTCILLGDGAGAVVIGRVEEGYGMLSAVLGADGWQGHNLTVPCCYISETDLEKRPNENKRVMWMDGSEVFKFAVRIMAEATLSVVHKAGLRLQDIKLIIPHQANIRIIEGASKRLGFPMEKIVSNVETYGNTSSASIPIALSEKYVQQSLKKGDYVVFVAFGGGLAWAATLMKWSL